jgi:hypothetical protein
VADKKIPLLTDVYQPKLGEQKPSESKPSDWIDLKPRQDDVNIITPELIARIVAHIKPRLEADITKTVTESVRDALRDDLTKALHDEMITTQAAIEARTVDFVDKTKADLKTDLPRMYQASADIVMNTLSENILSLQMDTLSKFESSLTGVMQAAVESTKEQISTQAESFQTDMSARMMHDINQDMQAFQVQSLSNHQALMGEEMHNVFQSVNQQAKTELQQQLEVMQAEALTQMRATFNEAMPSIYLAAVAEQQETITTQISERLNQELKAHHAEILNNHQAQQALVLSEHQAQLTEGLVANFQALNQNAKQDLHQQMSLLQADILSQMGTTFNDAIPSIYEAAVDEVKAKFTDEMTAQTLQVRDNFISTINADLPAVQEVLRDNIQHMLASAMPALEEDLRKQLITELQELLLKVKFVLPK